MYKVVYNINYRFMVLFGFWKSLVRGCGRTEQNKLQNVWKG